MLNFALKISFAFLVFKEISCLGNVPSPKLVLSHSARALIMCYCTAQNAFSLQITNLVMHRTQLQLIPQFKFHLDPRRKTILVGHLMNLKGLVPLINLTSSSNDSETTALVLCDTACSHSCISPELARRLNLTGRKIDLTVNGAICSKDITSEQADLNVSSEFDTEIFVHRLCICKKQHLDRFRCN